MEFRPVVPETRVVVGTLVDPVVPGPAVDELVSGLAVPMRRNARTVVVVVEVLVVGAVVIEVIVVGVVLVAVDVVTPLVAKFAGLLSTYEKFTSFIIWSNVVDL